MDIVIDKVTQTVEKVTISVDLPFFYKTDCGLDTPPTDSYYMLVGGERGRGTRYQITRNCRDWHEDDIVWEFTAEDVSVAGVLSNVYPLIQPGSRDYDYQNSNAAEFAAIYVEMRKATRGPAEDLGLAGV